ncbi:helix-turn-helix domain-containing protein [Niallia taxi]|uniref:helix-turn-helix transcriptional regulator n=1 Tax=Niallia taxi TaxID=2499688 RepID=UPI0021A91F11|nr:helix-turn-helix transcriptional regulator [Niallia taxi]MCT2347145.1 helix-turn-helix domain-containing protein [Niallia taxi]
MVRKREKLINLRKEKEMVQKEVVSLLKKTHGIDITESYYGMIELGVRTPSLTIALAISELFQTNPNEIFF